MRKSNDKFCKSYISRQLFSQSAGRSSVFHTHRLQNGRKTVAMPAALIKISGSFPDIIFFTNFASHIFIGAVRQDRATSYYLKFNDG